MKAEYRDFLTKTALCCSGFGLISNAIFVPASAEIMREFSDGGEFLMRYVISGNFIVSVPFALFSAYLTRYISKKKILVAALAMFFAGGFGNVFVPNLWSMAAARTLDAASDGMITTVAASLIAEVYKDERTQSQVLGRKEAVASVLGIGTGVLSGILVSRGWRYAFVLNVFSLIPLLLAVIFIPDTVPEGKRLQEKFRIDGKTAGHIIKNLLFFGLIQLIVCQVIYLIAAIIEEEGMGNSVYAGALTSVINTAMFFAYMAFSPLYLKIRRRIQPFLFLTTGISMMLMPMVENRMVFILLVIATAFAGALSYPYYSLVIAQDAPEIQISFWMSVYSCMIFTVASFSTYVPGVIRSVFHTTTILQTFCYSGGVLGAAGIFLLLEYIIKKEA